MDWLIFKDTDLETAGPNSYWIVRKEYYEKYFMIYDLEIFNKLPAGIQQFVEEDFPGHFEIKNFQNVVPLLIDAKFEYRGHFNEI